VDAPTAKDVREWSKLDFEELEFEAPPEGEDTPADPLERVVQRASAWLQFTVGRSWASVLPASDLALQEPGHEEETEEEFLDRQLEADFVATAMPQALLMLVEFTVFQSQPEHAETAADFGMIQSFSAGNYSETRRSVNAHSYALHPWSALSDLLGELLTPGRRGKLNEGPAISVDSPPRWDVGREIMGYSDWILTPFGRFQPPWDPIIEKLV
jgi:hypothetical protein